MAPQTKAFDTIIDRIEAEYAKWGNYGATLFDELVDHAREMVVEEGYAWDVALAKACEKYPYVKDVWRGAYACQ